MAKKTSYALKQLIPEENPKTGTKYIVRKPTKGMKVAEKLRLKKYVKGISCSNCYGKISNSKKKSLIDRNKQICIAKKKGLYSPYIKQTVNDV